MFTQKDFDEISASYFDIEELDPWCISLRSKSTGHQWFLIEAQRKGRGTVCVIFHRHSPSQPYHEHGWGPDVTSCLHSIEDHDLFQRMGRRPVSSLRSRMYGASWKPKSHGVTARYQVSGEPRRGKHRKRTNREAGDAQ